MFVGYQMIVVRFTFYFHAEPVHEFHGILALFAAIIDGCDGLR